MRLNDWNMNPIILLRAAAACVSLRFFMKREGVFTLVVIVQNTHYVEQRGLSRPRRTHNGYELTALYFEVDALQDMKRRTYIVCLVNILK